jgi:hypothetical protein
MNNLPFEIELIIYRYHHELCMNDLKKELSKNNKLFFIYTLKWRGIKNNYIEDIESINKSISCGYIKQKLLYKLNSLI